MIGRTIARYTIVEKLGEGGMGVVYLAEDTDLKRKVALKFLHQRFTADAERIERFKREAQAAASLSHPNIVTIHEIGEHAGRVFICMEYVEGRSLRDLIQEGPLSHDQALEIAGQVAEGLNAAHGAGIIHRDIKPENILMDHTGRIRIVDFGLAKLKGAGSLTRDSSTLGTVLYMSPEQVRGVDVDFRTDIWSLGVVLHEMLGGRPPFRGEYEQAVMYSIVHVDPEPLSGVCEDTEMLTPVLDRMLAKNPEDRYQDAGALCDALLTPRPAPAAGRFIGGGFRIGRFKAKRTYIVALAVLALLALSGVVGTWVQWFHRDTGPVCIIALPFENKGKPADENYAFAITHEITKCLIGISTINVKSYHTALSCRRQDKTVKEIHEELDVDYVLEGDVQFGDVSNGKQMIRLFPRLIDARQDMQVWMSEYKSAVKDFYWIQAALANKVAQRVGVEVLAAEYRRMNYPPSENEQAYRAYLKGTALAGEVPLKIGMQALDGESQMFKNLTTDNNQALLTYMTGADSIRVQRERATPGALYDAVRLFEEAVAHDPGYVSAYAEIAKWRSRLYYLNYERTEENLALAWAAAERVRELDPESPQVHVVRGWYRYWGETDFEQALQEFQLAEPRMLNDREILEAMAYAFRRLGRFEESLDRLKRLVVLDTRHLQFARELGGTLQLLRRYDEAEQWFDRSIELDPGQETAYKYQVRNQWLWKGATAKVESLLAAIPAGDDRTTLQATQALYEGRYAEALNLRASLQPDAPQHVAYNLLEMAELHRLLDRAQQARSLSDSARRILEPLVVQQDYNPYMRGNLGIACAGIGRVDEAIRHGEQAVSMRTVAQDTKVGPVFVEDLARIYTIVGEYDRAVVQIDLLLSIPSQYSVRLFEMDPAWNPLRNNIGFQQVLKKYAGDI